MEKHLPEAFNSSFLHVRHADSLDIAEDGGKFITFDMTRVSMPKAMLCLLNRTQDVSHHPLRKLQAHRRMFCCMSSL